MEYSENKIASHYVKSCQLSTEGCREKTPLNELPLLTLKLPPLFSCGDDSPASNPALFIFPETVNWTASFSSTRVFQVPWLVWMSSSLLEMLQEAWSRSWRMRTGYEIFSRLLSESYLAEQSSLLSKFGCLPTKLEMKNLLKQAVFMIFENSTEQK